MAGGRTRTRLGRATASVFSLTLAGILLYPAIPATFAAIVSLPGDSVLARIQNGEPVTGRELGLLVETRERALEWFPSARLHTDLGLAQLLQARQPPDSGGFDRALLRDAIRNLKTGLANGPARPYAWTRLAYAQLVADGASREVAQALEMALVTAPHEPRLLMPRLELCLLAWTFLSDTAQATVLDEIRLAWKRSPKALVRFARNAAQPEVVRLALRRTSEDLIEFDKLYSESR